MSSSNAFKKAMVNNESFSTMRVDQISSSSVCSEIYFDLLNKDTKSNSEIKTLDSLIIFGMDSTHFLHFMALNDKKHKTKFNDRIRHLAETYQNESAIFYLDKNNIVLDTAKTIESIQFIIENKFVGSEPKNELIILRNKLKQNNRW